MGKKRTQFDTKAEMRVVIAKDVLALLEAKAFTAQVGLYCVSSSSSKLLQLKDCRGCAAGGLFVAAVDRFNKLNLHVSIVEGPGFRSEFRHSVIQSYLYRFFSRQQFLLIETAFEGKVIPTVENLNRFLLHLNPGYDYVIDGPPSAVACVAFARRFLRPKTRLKAILKNIVRNGGQFVPSQLAGEKAA